MIIWRQVTEALVKSCDDARVALETACEPLKAAKKSKKQKTD